MNASRKLQILVAGLLAGYVAATSSVADAQEKPEIATIAVVDIQHLMQHTAAAKDVRAKVDKLRTDHQQETKSTLEGLKKLYEAVAKERPTLSEDAYQKRISGLREKAANYQDHSQKRLSDLDSALAAALQKIAGGIEESVNQIAKEQGLKLVLPRSGVIGISTVPDITQEVLKRLDRQLPTVVLGLPK